MNSGVGIFRIRTVAMILASGVLLFCWATTLVAQEESSTELVRVGREFKLRLRRQVTVNRENLRIKFTQVEDSRCPKDVTCVWAGNAMVRLVVSIRGRDSKTLTLNTNGNSRLPTETRYRGYTIKLVELIPYPRSNQRIMADSYVATLLVSKTGVRPASTK